MKTTKIKSLARILIGVVAAGYVTSCQKDYEYTPKPAPIVIDTTHSVTLVSFKTDLYPTFAANCTSSGCHDANDNTPDLSSESVAYTSLFNDPNAPNYPAVSDIDTVGNGANAAQSLLYVKINTGKMPKNGTPLSPAFCSTVLTWITQGAKNN